MMTRAVYDGAGLEVRREGRRRKIFGAFPYGALAVIADRGKVRKERINPGAFAFALEDATREINMLAGHSFDRPLASKKRGTLQFEDTPVALTFEADILPELEDVSHIRDALTLLEAGLVTGVSPGFRVPPPEVVPEAERLDPEPGNPGVFIRSLSAVILYELSLVTRPAYEASQAELRAMAQHAAHPVRPNLKVYLP